MGVEAWGGVSGGVPRGTGGGVDIDGDPGGSGGWNWKLLGV